MLTGSDVATGWKNVQDSKYSEMSFHSLGLSGPFKDSRRIDINAKNVRSHSLIFNT